MWMYDAEQSRYPQRVVRGQSWKPEWVLAAEATGSRKAGKGGDVLPLPTTAPVDRVTPIGHGTAGTPRPRRYRLRLHFARPAHRG